MEYNMTDAIVHIRRVASFFKLSTFSLIGHSMGKWNRKYHFLSNAQTISIFSGGMIITLFAATHPEMVSCIVVLDVTSPFPKKPEGASNLSRKHIDAVLKNEAITAEKSPKVYSMESRL